MPIEWAAVGTEIEKKSELFGTAVGAAPTTTVNEEWVAIPRRRPILVFDQPATVFGPREPRHSRDPNTLRRPVNPTRAPLAARPRSIRSLPLLRSIESAFH
jgi:hypothetical protein